MLFQSAAATPAEEQSHSTGLAALGESLGRLARSAFALISPEERFIQRVEDSIGGRFFKVSAGDASNSYFYHLSDERVRKHPRLEDRIIKQLLHWQDTDHAKFSNLPYLAGKETLTPRQRERMAEQILPLYRAVSATGTGVSSWGEVERNSKVDNLAEALYRLAASGLPERLVSEIISCTKVDPRLYSLATALGAQRDERTPRALVDHLERSAIEALHHPEAVKEEWCRRDTFIACWLKSRCTTSDPQQFVRDLELARSLTPGGVVSLEWWEVEQRAFELPKPEVLLPEIAASLAMAAERVPVRGVVKNKDDLAKLQRIAETFPNESGLVANISVITGGVAGNAG